jgi:hypothetical protein
MNEIRDERLGELLAVHVDAPPAVPGFMERLWHDIEASGVERRPRRHSLWRRRPLLAAAVFAAAVAAFLAISFLGGEGGVKSPVIEPLFKLGGPANASAAEVVAKARLALGKIRTLRARWQWSSAAVQLPEGDLEGMSVDEILGQATVGALIPYYPSDLTLTSDGHVRWDTDISKSMSSTEEDGEVVVTLRPGKAAHGMPPEQVDIRDETAGTSLFYQPEMRYPDSWSAETALSDSGYACGPPDANLTALVPFGTALSAFSALESGEVSESTFHGRPCLTVIAPVKPGPIEVSYDAGDDVSEVQTYLTVDKIELTVDKSSYIPVRIASYLRGKPVDVQTLEDLRINRRVSPSTFEYSFRDGAKVEHTDCGFRETSLADAGSMAGYTPLVPTYLPAGFKPNGVRYASRTTTWVQMSTENGAGETREVASRRITSIGYKKGFLHLTVSLRPTQGLDPVWLAEPFQEDPSLAGAMAPPEKVTISSGALAGSEAQISMPPLGVPHLWVVRDGMLVTVAGDATRAQLLRVAGSLEPFGAGE